VLTASGAVSRQDGDTQSTASKTAEANVTAGEKNVRAAQEFVRASKATLQRLITLQAYEKVTAPFAGVITSRNVDVGALISTTGSSQGPARPGASPTDVPSGGEVFRVAEISKLRILVSVPQTDAPGITVGQAADVTVHEFPNRTFPGKVTRTSNSLDAGSRTLLNSYEDASHRSISNPAVRLDCLRPGNLIGVLPDIWTDIRYRSARRGSAREGSIW
jgi:multidrug efflux pump subunit AcrA (membrane-fusion protein)